MTTFVPSFRAGIRGDERLPLVLPGFDAGMRIVPEPEPQSVPSWRAGLRSPWWNRLVGRGR